MPYDELGYRLPSEPTYYYADRAISRLKALWEIDPAFALYGLQATTVLLLADLRAESPYIAFEPDFQSAKLTAFRAALKPYGITTVNMHSLYDPGEPNYALFNTPVMRDLPSHYVVLHHAWRKPRSFYSYRDVAEWTYLLHQDLAELMEHNIIPKRWLRDWWAPHNIAFGMLLGYPSEAISSLCWREAGGGPPGSKDGTMIRMRHGGNYFSPLVAYDACDEVARPHGNVKTHSLLWNAVLDAVYAHFPHDRLMQNRRFRVAYEQLESHENTLSEPVAVYA